MEGNICSKCGKKIEENWPAEKTGGLCQDCAYEDFQKQYHAGDVIGTEKHKEKESKNTMYV